MKEIQNPFGMSVCELDLLSLSLFFFEWMRFSLFSFLFLYLVLIPRQEINRMLSRNKMHMCGVCYTPLGESFVKTLCGHFFCKKCLRQAIAKQAREEAQLAAQGQAMDVEGTAAHGKCPMCKRPLHADILKSQKKVR